MSGPSSVVRTSGGIVTTDAQIKVACGFKPAFVHVVNRTLGSSIVWNAGMPQDSGLRQSGVTLTTIFVTTSGITTYEDSTGEGFAINPVIGVNNNSASHPLYWAAFRGDGSPGN